MPPRMALDDDAATLTTADRAALVSALAPRLVGVPWSTDPITAAYNAMLLDLAGDVAATAAGAVALQAAPELRRMGLAPDPAAKALSRRLGAAARVLGPADRTELLASAWQQANGRIPPNDPDVGYHSLGGALAAVALDHAPQIAGALRGFFGRMGPSGGWRGRGQATGAGAGGPRASAANTAPPPPPSDPA